MDGHRLLDQVSGEFPAGQVTAVAGPSGSGKTTLLQMIAGLVAPTQGSLHIDGKDATHMPASERGIGLVFQSYALFPHLSVAENVAYPLRMRRVPAKRIAADECLIGRAQACRFRTDQQGGRAGVARAVVGRQGQRLVLPRQRAVADLAL